ncbi:hypothetical protein Ocin01_07273 [Orchesella cincta]|uniref:Uncharacterized protein n=1 Tax=Orchesella cincta TaxID=48709 RepID=A0A1D2N2B1_ORCCI|nr:hypothetical protein Ocin01_07273 [Orchesella cincta]
MKFQDFVCVALLSTLFLAAPTLCEDDEAVQANLTKSSGHINSPGLDRIKLSASGNQNASAKQSAGQGNPLTDSTSNTGGEPNAAKKSGNLSSIHDTESDETHFGDKRVESRSNASSSESGFVPSNHFLFVDHHAQGAAPPLSKRNSSADDFAHVEKHQLHQSLSDDSDDSFLAPPPVRKQSTHPKLGDSVIVSSDSVPVRIPPSTNTQVDNQGNPSIAIRRPIPLLRQQTAQKASVSNDSDDF